VFRSSDGGSSWTAANGGLGSFPFVLSLAVDPRDPAVVLAGTAGGIFETTSGGELWRRLPLVLPTSTAVSRVAFDPARPRILYAATGEGLFRSGDGGAHWTKRDAGLPPGQLTALYLDPDRPGTLYASVSDNLAPSVLPRVYKTTDGGGRWTALAGLRTSYVATLVRHRASDTLYAPTTEGLFATRDGGATWTLLSADIFDKLVVAPSGTLYGDTGSGGVVTSVDGGLTWSYPVPSLPAVPYGGAESLALDSSGNHLLAGAFGLGIYSLDAGGSWTRVNRGFRAAYITGLAVSPASPSLLFVGTLGQGLLASADGGASFVGRNAGLPLIDLGAVDVTAIAVDPKSPRSLAIGVGFAGGTVAQTSNAGRRWTFETPICLTVDSLALAPPDTLFAASTAAFYGSQCTGASTCTAKVSHDGGSSFTCLDGPPEVSAFLVDPLRPAVVYAAAGDAIWKSTDRGGHFTRVADRLGAIVTSLAASPAAHQTLYAGSRQGVLKSTDGGTTWSPSFSGLVEATGGWVSALVVDPVRPATVYLGVFGVGVFASTDGGASWSALGEGFPAGGFSPYPALALDSARHVLYAGTQGAGAWVLSLP
jgi:photosystem II stability/assembly factor-like uncharacterized protein